MWRSRHIFEMTIKPPAATDPAPSERDTPAQNQPKRPRERRSALGDRSAGGADQPAVADKAVIDALIDRQVARHAGRLQLTGEIVAVVEQRIEAADDQMGRCDAF